MISVRVRNFRGCAKAEIVCDPIALVAGHNTAGKSSLAMAVGAALVGTTRPLNIVSKKDAPALVMTGASEGLAELTAEGGGIARTPGRPAR
jgi:predicted ATPase